MVRTFLIAAVAIAAAGCWQEEPVSVVGESLTKAEAAAPSKPVISKPRDNWPGWRGPNGDGHSRSPAAPLRFNEQTNCLWSTETPGTGHSSPVVVLDRVYLTSADEKLNQQNLLVYDRVTGQLVRERLLHRERLGTRHRENTHASSTPVWSANRLFLVFANLAGLYLSATDREGSLLWQKRVGEYRASEGYGASPLVWKSLVIVSGDSSGGSTLAAFEQATGRVVWKAERPRIPTFSSPAILRAAGLDQLLLCGARRITSYNPDTGELLWEFAGPWDTTCGTMCAYDDIVFCSGGVPENRTMALRAVPGLPDHERVVWQTSDRFYVPSLTVHEDRVFGVTDNGIAIVYEARTGTELCRQRLGGNFYATPAMAGDIAYVPNAEGTLFVFRPDARKVEVLARNEMQDGCYASPAICKGRVYVRTRGELLCFGEMPGYSEPVGTLASER